MGRTGIRGELKELQFPEYPNLKKKLVSAIKEAAVFGLMCDVFVCVSPKKKK